MVFVANPRQVVETVVLLGAKYRDAAGPAGKDMIRRGYLRFLADYQPYVPDADTLETEFVSDPERTHRLVTLFNEESRLADLHKRVIDENRVRDSGWGLHVAHWAFDHIKSQNALFWEILSLQTKIVFSARSSVSGGGTTSGAIGVIWADIRKSWSLGDVIEFYVHENAHTSMFLDELRYRHYQDLRVESMDRSRFAVSAVLAVPRPIDKVLHSLVVSTEVILAREEWLGHPESPRLHPPSEPMLASTKATIESLESTSATLMPRARHLIEMCRERLDGLQAPQRRSSSAGVWSMAASAA